MTITVREQVLVRALSGITAFFVVAHLAGQTVVAIVSRDRLHQMRLLALIDQFNLDGETNLPTYFSSFLLALCAGLLLLIARRIRETRRPMAAYWRVLGWMFLAMSFDEFSSLHEKVGTYIKGHVTPMHGVFYSPWVIAGLPFVAVLGAVYMRFLLRLPARFRIGFVLAGSIYVGGALGMEMLDGWYADIHGYENWTYVLLTTIEEAMEMAGAIVFAKYLRRYLADDGVEVRLNFPSVPDSLHAPPSKELQ
jgi:hypothetical protein